MTGTNTGHRTPLCGDHYCYYYVCDEFINIFGDRRSPRAEDSNASHVVHHRGMRSIWEEIILMVRWRTIDDSHLICAHKRGIRAPILLMAIISHIISLDMDVVKRGCCCCRCGSPEWSDGLATNNIFYNIVEYRGGKSNTREKPFGFWFCDDAWTSHVYRRCPQDTKLQF